MVHTLHQRPFDDAEGGAQLHAGLFGVGFDIVRDPFDEGVGKPLL